MPDRDLLLAEVQQLRGAAKELTSKLGVAQRQVRLLLAMVAALALLATVVTVLVVRGIGETSRINDQVQKGVRGTCSFWHDLAVLPLQKNATSTALSLVADARLAYFGLDCLAGGGDPLPPPDPRVAKLLPKGQR